MPQPQNKNPENDTPRHLQRNIPNLKIAIFGHFFRVFSADFADLQAIFFSKFFEKTLKKLEKKIPK